MLKESSTLADLVAPKAATCTFHAGCDYGKGSRESGTMPEAPNLS